MRKPLKDLNHLTKDVLAKWIRIYEAEIDSLDERIERQAVLLEKYMWRDITLHKPKAFDVYYVTTASGNVMMAVYSKNGWMLDTGAHVEDERIIAWMPCLEPYKRRKDD